MNKSQAIETLKSLGEEELADVLLNNFASEFICCLQNVPSQTHGKTIYEQEMDKILFHKLNNHHL